jgi:hypothetical protein
MTGLPRQPPRGLRWTATAAARGITTLVALATLLLAVVLGVRQQFYISCVGDRQQADAERTAAISEATEAERAADRELLADPNADRRARALAARQHTDRVRAEYPAPAPRRC